MCTGRGSNQGPLGPKSNALPLHHSATYKYPYVHVYTNPRFPAKVRCNVHQDKNMKINSYHKMLVYICFQYDEGGFALVCTCIVSMFAGDGRIFHCKWNREGDQNVDSTQEKLCEYCFKFSCKYKRRKLHPKVIIYH